MTVLFLDFDGVLHPDSVYQRSNGAIEMYSMLADEGHALFEYCGYLIDILKRYPHIHLNLSTSWVRVLRSVDKAKGYLPPALADKVLGAVWHPGEPASWASLSRYEQIIRFVRRYHLTRWVAIDDDAKGWPSNQSHRLVRTNRHTGLSDPSVRDDLDKKLDAIMKIKIRADPRFDIRFRLNFGVDIVRAGTPLVSYNPGHIIRNCVVVDKLPLNPFLKGANNLFDLEAWIRANVYPLDGVARAHLDETIAGFLPITPDFAIGY
ncbi:MAG: HAD domain-containing protein [Thiobacillus sp.]